ncbi:fungal cellulose binding domain-containing protein [Coprinopsis cinerea okayama7|uniref:Feruloyl esterase C n=2 Tax=Coprinopsis cinerea TaxID=5346 RepID=A8NZS7_COPC7|nr:fungal cellulose binding domain-containing protein [Coprinopsis cinerea okayama7\|eukprot:XP_001837739.1 fungal cellulose binding domain-containing protein [Coprinopsis cinerea okayama7\
MRAVTAFFLLLAATLQGVIAASTPGCGRSPPSSGTKNIGNRQYILQVPANYDPNRPYKLIFGFHWLGGNMNNVAPGYYGLRALANESAIFVAPNGLDAGWANTGGRDTTFVNQMLTELKNSMCVDDTQIFATGFSYGGGMSYSLACSNPRDFRAVSVIAGAQLSGCSGGETRVAYLGIHGVVDSVLNVSAGRQLRDRYLRVNGCQSKNAPEPPRGPDSNYMKTEYSCAAGYPVWWIAHGGDHVAQPSGQNWMATQTWDFWTRAIYEGVENPNPPTNPPPTQPTQPPTQPTNPPPGNCAARYGQCGGQGWNGPSCCQSGASCQVVNQWYHQCL